MPHKIQPKTLAKATIFCSSFLLFFLQPLITKILLPYYGGGQMVWVTALVFFQVVLLLGYAYVHLLTYLPQNIQKMIHYSLLAVSLWFIFSFNLTISPSSENYFIDLMLTLTRLIGLPFFLLASTSPLIQYWIEPKEKQKTYKLYAISNLASVFSLILYPFIVEPLFGIAMQSILFAFTYLVYVILLIVFSYQIVEQEPNKFHWYITEKTSMILRWIAFPAVASSLLVSITNQLTTDITPTPFVWMAPLFLYLLTFILVFSEKSVYNRMVFSIVFFLALLKFVILYDLALGMSSAISTYGLMIFASAMICHGEVYLIKPRSQNLTLFYFCLSLGGALGGIFAGVIVPIIFSTLLETPIAIFGVLVILFISMSVDPKSRQTLHTHLITTSLLVFTTIAFTGILFYNNHLFAKTGESFSRNFFGVLLVKISSKDGITVKNLVHGNTLHGTQIMNQEYNLVPTTYFGQGSGIEWLIDSLDNEKKIKMGVVGLGVGTLAGYRDKVAEIQFYEINPDVVNIAKNEFDYLKSFPGKLTIHDGDARLQLAQQEPQNFDVLVIDAFSSDAIPTHLLTKEALEIYQRHLIPGGVIAYHISNRHLDLSPIIGTLAKDAGLASRLYETNENIPWYVSKSTWVFVSKDPVGFGEKIRTSRRLWTDDYSSIFTIIR